MNSENIYTPTIQNPDNKEQTKKKLDLASAPGRYSSLIPRRIELAIRVLCYTC
jgi:hypothetical protein